MTLIVAKFGGTSMGNAEIIMKSSLVLKSRPGIRLCVISATAGSTNQLNRMCSQVIELDEKLKQQALNELTDFSDRHLKMAQDLEVSNDSKNKIHSCLKRLGEMMEGFRLLREVSNSARDEFLSHGEIISSILFYEALLKNKMKAKWIDIRPIMKTSSDFGKATPHLDLLKLEAQKYILPELKDFILVTQGYIGSDLANRSTTLGKEGSDYSTALLAEALEADEVQIWKDVPGIMTTDPKLVQNAKTISEISFQEVSELTRFGAKVIHPDTFLPIIRKNIPLYVGYPQNPELSGTKIGSLKKEAKDLKALSLKKEVSVLRLTPIKNQKGLTELTQVLNFYQKENKDPLFISTSSHQIIVVYDSKNQLSSDAQKDLSEFFQIDLKSELHLIALIGSHLADTPFLTKLIQLLDIPVYHWMIDQSPTSLTFLVDQIHGENLLKKIHHHFLEKV